MFILGGVEPATFRYKGSVVGALRPNQMGRLNNNDMAPFLLLYILLKFSRRN